MEIIRMGTRVLSEADIDALGSMDTLSAFHCLADLCDSHEALRARVAELEVEGKATQAIARGGQ